MTAIEELKDSVTPILLLLLLGTALVGSASRPAALAEESHIAGTTPTAVASQGVQLEILIRR